MNSRFDLRLVIGALVLALVTGAAPAQTDNVVDEPEAPPPEFEIEIIIFEYAGGAVGAREDWAYIDTGRDAVTQQMISESEMILDLPPIDTVSDDVMDGQMIDEEPKPLVWTPIADDQRRLTDTVAKMRNSRDYKPLVHAAWRQPVYGESDTTTLALERVAGTPSNLGASASIYVERFLHLTLDLELAKPITQAEDLPGSLIYRLEEKRKMRSGETHFFDHPRFGAVALISKPDPETVTSDDAIAPSEATDAG